MNRSYAVLLACLTLSVGALAAPRPESKYLIHEPASLLDLGLVRLRSGASDILASNLATIGLKGPVVVEATYNYEHDRIHLVLLSAETVSEPKEVCRRLVTTVQTWMTSSPVWAQGFAHSGYTANQVQDEAVKAALPEMIVIEARVYGGPATSVAQPPPLRCSGTLQTVGVTFN